MVVGSHVVQWSHISFQLPGTSYSRCSWCQNQHILVSKPTNVPCPVLELWAQPYFCHPWSKDTLTPPSVLTFSSSHHFSQLSLVVSLISLPTSLSACLNVLAATYCTFVAAMRSCSESGPGVAEGSQEQLLWPEDFLFLPWFSFLPTRPWFENRFIELTCSQLL